MTGMMSDYVRGEHRKALLALSIRTRKNLELMTREALATYLAAKGADSLECLASQTGLPTDCLLEEALLQYLARER